MSTTKRNMSTEKKFRTPQLRFPGFTGGWKEKKLGDVTNNEDSKRCPIARMNRQDGVYPYYGANGIQDYVDGYIFDGDYLLVGEDGSVLSKENTPVIHWATGKFWVNNHAHVLSQKVNVNLKFVSYNLTTIKIQGLVTGIPPKLNQENLNNISLPIPSKPEEQQKIADCLSELDALITAQGQKVEALKEKKKGLLQQMFPQNGETTPRLRFSGFTGEWKERKLDKILIERKEVSIITEALPQLSFTIAEGVIWPEDRKTNQRDFLITDKDNKKFAITRLNDIIYNPANVVYGAIHKNNLCDGVVSPIYKIFWTRENADFVNYLLRRPEFISLLASRAEGTVTKLKTLKAEAFLEMFVLFPDNPMEQAKIAECLSALDDQIAAEAKRLDALKEHKKGLMRKLFPATSK